MDPRDTLNRLFEAAVGAADPLQVLKDYLPEQPKGRTVVIGAGKAAASMAKALETHWSGELSGLVVTRYEHGLDCDFIEVVEAAHPVPDGAGEAVAKRILEMVQDLTADDLVICLISGGGSSLLALAPGLTLADKQQINKALLKSGATISEMNCVRKHLSAIKGGRLGALCAPAKVVTLGISDVPGDDPDVIASGPTIGDPTTSQDALAIINRYGFDVPQSVRDWLASPESETVKPEDPRLQGSEFHMIATPQKSLEAAAAAAKEMGIPSLILSDCVEGESREIAKFHAAMAEQVINYGQPIAAPCVILSGGETTVTVRGNGQGGRNAEFMLSLLCSLKGKQRVYAVAADTDGIDGTEDNAGAILTPDSFQRAIDAGLDLNAMLDNNDGYNVFKALDNLIITGQTRTNVNDFRAILITD
ncbi:MAG: glycerate kinase [Pseudomonadales bacterium]